jgi:hypothetical protein
MKEDRIFAFGFKILATGRALTKEMVMKERENIWPMIAVFMLLGAVLAYGGPAGAGLAEGAQKPLEVKGQTRNVSMMTVNQANKNQVKFVKPRKDYQREIIATAY